MKTERTGGPTAARCLAIWGRGTPNGAALEVAVEAVSAVAEELHAAKRRVGHEWKPPAPEVQRAAPAQARRATGWTVLVRVPAFVSARDVRAAAREASDRHPAAGRVHLEVLAGEPATRERHPGRDRLPGTIRRTREGALAQHRARDLQ
ncbi:MAG TPA: hypothetical protein VML50_18960 [Anaeromyxobacter sp.]|nr:hypothetical protein [Anaeromyxobacter sp.]